MNFEKKVEELESIVGSLESGSLTIEESVALFEKGVAVTRECLTTLNENRGKIDAVKAEMERLFEDADEE